MQFSPPESGVELMNLLVSNCALVSLSLYFILCLPTSWLDSFASASANVVFALFDILHHVIFDVRDKIAALSTTTGLRSADGPSRMVIATHG